MTISEPEIESILRAKAAVYAACSLMMKIVGIGFDEALAAQHPCDDANPAWTVARAPDGTLWRP